MTKQNEKDAKRVPELRFKGFTDDWEQVELNDIADKSTLKNRKNENKIVLTNSAELGIVKQQDYFDKDIANSKNLSNYYVVKNNYFVYNPRISNQAKYGPINYNSLGIVGIMSPLYFVFKVHNNVNNIFLGVLFKTSVWHRFMYENGDTGARADRFSIKDSVFMTMPLNIPSITEQSKIAKLFQSLDKTITLHEEQHRQLERLKKALLQKMFADETGYPALRFKGFTEKWEQSYLKDIASVNSGRDYKHLNKGNIPVYGTGGYMLSVDKALSNTKDGIGIGRKGTINNPYILKAPFWTVDTLFYVIPYNVDLNFLYGIFQKIDWRKKDESTGVPSLSKENINKTKFKIPAISEQKEIGTIFQNLDTLITLHQHKIDNLKRLKRALLQKMFV